MKHSYRLKRTVFTNKGRRDEMGRYLGTPKARENAQKGGRGTYGNI